jgi:N-acetylglucosamine-6-phosphate deacetylase
MMAAAGMPPGRCELGGQAVEVDAASARLADGTLAGAVLTLDEGVRNMACWTDATPAAALRMATETPARLLGVADRGQLVAGAIADLALFDADLHLRETIIAGLTVFRAT